MSKKHPKPKHPKSPRRVQWEPSTPAATEVQDEVVDTRAEDYADRIPSNDENLQRDKPPHWS